MIVLDTNVLSELMRPKPNESVVQYLEQYSLSDGYITSITQAEILYGIEVLADGKRKTELTNMADKLFNNRFANRIYSFDSLAATHYARIMAHLKRIGKLVAMADLQIAAIAKSRGAAVVTRNIADFSDCGIPLINPWDLPT